MAPHERVAPVVPSSRGVARLGLLIPARQSRHLWGTRHDWKLARYESANDDQVHEES